MINYTMLEWEKQTRRERNQADMNMNMYEGYMNDDDAESVAI